MRSPLIVKRQQIHDFFDIQLHKAGLEGLSHNGKLRCRDDQTQLPGGAVERDRPDDPIFYCLFRQEGMPASTGINRVLRIHDIVFVYQREAVESQQRFDFPDRILQFFLRVNLFILNKGDGFFHLLKVTVDEIRDGFCAAVRHCLKIKGADRGDRFICRGAGLSRNPYCIGRHHRQDQQAAQDGCQHKASVRYLSLLCHKISPYNSASINAASF